MQALDLASRIQALNLNENFKPRAYLDGVTIPASFELPDLKSVREEALLSKSRRSQHLGSPSEYSPIVQEALEAPLEPYKMVTLTNKGYRPTRIDNPTRPLVCNLLLRNLFKWSYFVHSSDGECIFSA